MSCYHRPLSDISDAFRTFIGHNYWHLCGEFSSGLKGAKGVRKGSERGQTAHKWLTNASKNTKR